MKKWMSVLLTSCLMYGEAAEHEAVQHAEIVAEKILGVVEKMSDFALGVVLPEEEAKKGADPKNEVIIDYILHDVQNMLDFGLETLLPPCLRKESSNEEFNQFKENQKKRISPVIKSSFRLVTPLLSSQYVETVCAFYQHPQFRDFSESLMNVDAFLEDIHASISLRQEKPAILDSSCFWHALSLYGIGWESIKKGLFYMINTNQVDQNWEEILKFSFSLNNKNLWEESKEFYQSALEKKVLELPEDESDAILRHAILRACERSKKIFPEIFELYGQNRNTFPHDPSYGHCQEFLTCILNGLAELIPSSDQDERLNPQ